jgi:two-component system chemotaxis response regulator CheB
MIQAITIGASYGGMEAIRLFLQSLPNNFKTPIVIVLHIGNNKINSYLSVLNSSTQFKVKEAEEKEELKPKRVIFAPPNYHLLIEDNLTLSLSTDSKVNYSRPSIDVLFETAAWSLKNNLIGILLTGSNNDGAQGLKTIKKCGGITIVQNPDEALAKTMPEAAIKLCKPNYILDLKNMASKVAEICS